MKDEDEVKQGFIIKDRRRFDDAGEEKPSSEQGSGAADRPPEQQTERGRAEAEVTFSSFVVSLATQALMQLGELKPPSGVGIAVDVEGAKRMIDLLSMLQEKTKGNLDDDEAKLIEEVLHTLRLSFVKSK